MLSTPIELKFVLSSSSATLVFRCRVVRGFLLAARTSLLVALEEGLPYWRRLLS